VLVEERGHLGRVGSSCAAKKAALLPHVWVL
jgi:hypothetical protein